MSPNTFCQRTLGTTPSKALTIPSLQIGQTSLELAVAAEAEIEMFSFCSRDIRDLRSWISGGEVCAVEADDVSEVVLAEGDSKLEFL